MRKDLSTSSASAHRKQSIDLLKKLYSFSSPDNNTNFPVLKIEEDDLDDITMTNSGGVCKTISTQTSPVNERTAATTKTGSSNTANNRNNNKKGSASSLWSSEESILRSADTVDEDNKSTSSSACDETGGAISSGKSGKNTNN